MKKFIRNLLIGFVPFLPVEKVQATDSVGTMDSAEQVNINNNKKVLPSVKDVQELLDLLEKSEPSQPVLPTNAAAKIDSNPLTNTTHFVQTVSTNKSSEVQELLDLLEKSDSSQPAPATNTVPDTVAESVQESLTNITASVQNTTPLPHTEKIVEKETHLATNDQNGVKKDLWGKQRSIPSPKENPLDRIPAPLKISFVVIMGVIGACFISRKLDRFSKKRWENYVRAFSNDDLDQEKLKAEDLVSQMVRNLPPVQPRTEKRAVKSPSIQQKVSPKRKKVVIPVAVDGKSDEEKYQLGIRQLSNIKMRRMAINRQMKALRQEMVKYHQSSPRWAAIANQMSELAQERRELAMMARQARILVKGKQGKLIQDERRLLSKQMRLAKKTNDTERINKIMQKRLDIKIQEKQILSEAMKKVKERQEEASRWHGLRLFREAHAEEKFLKERLKQLKKETGLKQKEILELEEDLNNQYKQIKAKKNLARKKSKGSLYTAKKARLSKAIILAHQNNDAEAEDALKQELQALKRVEKEHMKQTENTDYLAKRRKKIQEIHPIVDEHIKSREAEEEKRKVQEQERQAAEQHQKDRDERALFLHGQRMLRDLSNGLSETVNLNQMTPQDYKKWAYGKIGKNGVNGFNYEAERASFLKANVLGRIYLHKKQQGLIK